MLARALGADVKGKISPFLYLTAIALAFVAPWAAQAIYVGVALMWLVPDRRIERWSSVKYRGPHEARMCVRRFALSAF